MPMTWMVDGNLSARRFCIRVQIFLLRERECGSLDTQDNQIGVKANYK